MKNAKLKIQNEKWRYLTAFSFAFYILGFAFFIIRRLSQNRIVGKVCEIYSACSAPLRGIPSLCLNEELPGKDSNLE